jgi:hypothetical protein
VCMLQGTVLPPCDLRGAGICERVMCGLTASLPYSTIWAVEIALLGVEIVEAVEIALVWNACMLSLGWLYPLSSAPPQHTGPASSAPGPCDTMLAIIVLINDDKC